MEALHDVVKAGKARYIGASSMYAWQFAKAQYVAIANGWTPFVTMQNHYNLLYREEEREMLPLCADLGVGVIPWSPLARGRLTRDWDATTARSETDEFGKTLYRDDDAAIVDAVARDRRAARRQPGPGRAGLGVAAPAVDAPIIGATKPGHIDDAVASLDLELTDDEVAELKRPYTPRADRRLRLTTSSVEPVKAEVA